MGIVSIGVVEVLGLAESTRTGGLGGSMMQAVGKWLWELWMLGCGAPQQELQVAAGPLLDP